MDFLQICTTSQYWECKNDPSSDFHVFFGFQAYVEWFWLSVYPCPSSFLACLEHPAVVSIPQSDTFFSILSIFSFLILRQAVRRFSMNSGMPRIATHVTILSGSRTPGFSYPVRQNSTPN